MKPPSGPAGPRRARRGMGSDWRARGARGARATKALEGTIVHTWHLIHLIRFHTHKIHSDLELQHLSASPQHRTPRVGALSFVLACSAYLDEHCLGGSNAIQCLQVVPTVFEFKVNQYIPPHLEPRLGVSFRPPKSADGPLGPRKGCCTLL